ncbi:hypothetical protein ACQ86C_15835 [Enterobacter asburiae]
MVADYTRSDTGATAKVEAKKTCASAQVGARDEYETVLRILTNQYLWDLDCGRSPCASPAGKRKGMSLSATRCEYSLLLLQIELSGKKTCVKTQVGVKRVNQPELIPPINTSGTLTVSTSLTTSPSANRNSLTQSVTKGSD